MSPKKTVEGSRNRQAYIQREGKNSGIYDSSQIERMYVVQKG